MSVSEEQNTKLFKARRTVVQMLRDRGYSVPDSDIKMTRQQFIEKYGENVHLKRDDLLILCSKGDAPTDQIYVFFPAEVKVGVPMVRNCAKRMKADNVYNAILVVQRALTAPAKAAINEINSYFHMEVFEEAELLTNITEHMFVDKGAHGFMRTHKWRDSIGAFINVEASGTGGLDLVCKSGPGSWPSSVYAQLAIYPMAHSAAQMGVGEYDQRANIRYADSQPSSGFLDTQHFAQPNMTRTFKPTC